MNLIVRLFVILLPVSLMGCSYFSKPSFFQTRNANYLSATSIPPLKVPPGTAANGFHESYPVSNRQDPAAFTPVDLTPPGLYPPSR